MYAYNTTLEIMDITRKVSKLLAPLVIGCGLVVGIGTVAEAHHKHHNYHHNHHGGHHHQHRRGQRLRSLKVTPRHHIPSPADYRRSHEYDYNHVRHGRRHNYHQGNNGHYHYHGQSGHRHPHGRDHHHHPHSRPNHHQYNNRRVRGHYDYYSGKTRKVRTPRGNVRVIFSY